MGWDTDTWSHRHIFYRYNIIVNKHIDNKSVRYIVLDTLGAGSYGQVFKCQDLDKRDVVAIKVMSWDKHRTSDRAFENEKRILSMVCHLPC